MEKFKLSMAWRMFDGKKRIEKPIITSGQIVVVIRVQFSSWMSVPFRRDVACICGQNPLVLVKHHSPHDTHGQ